VIGHANFVKTLSFQYQMQLGATEIILPLGYAWKSGIWCLNLNDIEPACRYFAAMLHEGTMVPLEGFRA